MSKFPKQPFTLKEGKEGDQQLLDYLKAPEKNFKYLGKTARGIISGLPTTLGDDGLQGQQRQLLELWPEVLTDALLMLKESDSREYDPKNPKLKSFFHAESLGVTELKDILTGFSEFEGMLYGASPDRYRDHIVHSFRVWIIGQGILKAGFKGSLATYEAGELKVSSTEWECMWAIVALCHDIGYPLSAVEKINERARSTFKKQGLVPEGDLKFTFRQQMLPFHDTMIQLMASRPVKEDGKRRWHTHLQNKYYVKLLKSFDQLHHGVISALLVSRGLVYFLESDLSHDARKPLTTPDARQFLIRREILRAIAAHTCADIYHLHFDTLAFLLYIVDELQCWGRPTFEELQGGLANYGRSQVTVADLTGKRIGIEIVTDDPAWNKDQRRGMKLQIGRLHRMLRLAVDTPKLAKGSVLTFKMSNKGKEYCILKLQGGGIDTDEHFNGS
jgi:hypothetical protein